MQCPVCGETEPYPAWICVNRRVLKNAAKGEPCTYSVEGNLRFKATMIAEIELADRPSPPTAKEKP